MTGHRVVDQPLDLLLTRHVDGHRVHPVAVPRQLTGRRGQPVCVAVCEDDDGAALQ